MIHWKDASDQDFGDDAESTLEVVKKCCLDIFNRPFEKCFTTDSEQDDYEIDLQEFLLNNPYELIAYDPFYMGIHKGDFHGNLYIWGCLDGIYWLYSPARFDGP